jgi:hypothetical protein
MLPGSSLFPITPFTNLCRILSVVALLGFPIIPWWIIKKWRSLKSVELKGSWLLIGACYLFLLCLHYPGYVGSDDLFTGSVLITGKAWGWQSLTYSIFLETSMLLTGGYGLPPVLFILIFMALILRLFLLLDLMGLSRRWLIFLSVLSILLALHPFNQCLLLYHSRDVLFSLVLCHMGFFLLEKNKWNTGSVLLFALCAIFLGDLRQEAKIYLFLFPLAYFLNGQWKWKQLKIYFPVILVFGYLYFGTLDRYFDVDPYTHDYQVTALVLPLSQIFHDLKPEEISPGDTANINAVLDVEKLKNYFNPLDIDPFHQGAFNHNTTPEEWNRFIGSAKNLIFEHFSLFLSNRIFLSKSALNIYPSPLIYNDEIRWAPDLFPKLRQRLNIPASRLIETSWPLMHTQFVLFTLKHGSWIDTVSSSLLLPLIFLLASLFFFSRSAIVLFAALIAIRLPILFLTAPAAYTKYLYSIQIYSTLVFILSLGLWARKSPNKSEGPNPA